MRCLVINVVLALWFSGGQLWAGLSASIPFSRLNADESRILVMRDGRKGYSNSQVRNPVSSSGVEIDFLNMFPESGVYSWPDQKLIYGINWFCLDRELESSPDLVHLARINRFGNGWALKFYASGKVSATVTIEQLLTAFRFEGTRPFSTWDWYHRWHEAFEFKNGKLIVTTVIREIGGVSIGFSETHTFDMATGTLESTTIHKERFNALLIGLFGGLLLLLASLVFARGRLFSNGYQRKSETRSMNTSLGLVPRRSAVFEKIQPLGRFWSIKPNGLTANMR